MQLSLGIQSIGAWSPEYQTLSHWLDWPQSPISELDPEAKPKLAQVPAMQRRRFSRLSKMLLEVAFQCQAPAQCRSIFASRHGELHRTLGLLKDIIKDEPISPIGFSQSVHNTASGLYTILTDNQAPSTSIAACQQSLLQALIEAYCQLAQQPEPLLLAFGDEPVPDIYANFVNESELPIAMALLLTPSGQGELGQLTVNTRNTQGEPLSYGAIIHAIATGHSLTGQFQGYQWCINP
ncbi:beta-ketoacyl synthase chain length factor [Shewanella waksmanii]|uniref:beta-ketoacyl synthase chain length factor n=1 Tax=Shewanella waksmanii TaxID=213783 RepID=UPI00048CC2FE|nr:beta-ketoacyl synthase chain length factor [Shewanella waksmanii]